MSTANPANIARRVEAVAFGEPGDHFVICNVQPHCVDGRRAIIEVR